MPFSPTPRNLTKALGMVLPHAEQGPVFCLAGATGQLMLPAPSFLLFVCLGAAAFRLLFTHKASWSDLGGSTSVPRPAALRAGTDSPSMPAIIPWSTS